jgi:LPXTG-motif cell wall-anchored protein
MKKLLKINLIVLVAFVLYFSLANRTAFACDENYGGGETCIVNKSFNIDKDVKFEDEDDDEYSDKVYVDLTDKDERSRTIVFRITIKNTTSSEDTDVEDMEFDKMKMLDDLPDELKRVGGSGLSEYFDNFNPGEKKTFYIKVRLTDDELDKDGEFEKCVVNVAKVYYDSKKEGESAATVCYSNTDLKELPKTGGETPLVLGSVGLGIASIGSLAFLKKRK